LANTNAVGMAQKLLLFWRKPARRCWWEGVELDNVRGVEGKLKVWIRRVWTLEMVRSTPEPQYVANTIAERHWTALTYALPIFVCLFLSRSTSLVHRLSICLHFPPPCFFEKLRVRLAGSSFLSFRYDTSLPWATKADVRYRYQQLVSGIHVNRVPLGSLLLGMVGGRVDVWVRRIYRVRVVHVEYHGVIILIRV